MSSTTGFDSKLPRHWIGVYEGWDSAGGRFWERLVELPPDRLRTHALLLGATGSGKTNLIHHLIAQDVLLGNSFAVLDLRGDLVRAVTEICAQRVDPSKAKILDLRDKRAPLGFDPLFGKGEPYFRALNVHDVVADESGSWGVQLSETLRNGLMLLAEAGRPLTMLEDLFYDREFLHVCLAQCAAAPVVSFWGRFDEMPKDRKSALAMPVTNKVSLLLATDTLRRVLGHERPLDLGAHLDTPGSALLVSLAADELHSAGRMMGKLVLSSVCREIFARVDVPEARRNPVRLYVDEFEHFGLAEFETILAEGRRFGLSLVLAHQTLAQLSPRMRSMVLANVGTKAVFRCGREDAAYMGRDIDGDPALVDYTAFPTGVARLWRRNEAAANVEINEPIVSGSQGPSAAARAFRRAAADCAGPGRATRPDMRHPFARASGVVAGRKPDGAGGGAAATAARPQPVETSPKSAMEDWLCG